MNSSIVDHMAKMSMFRLTGKNVKIDNVNKWVSDVEGLVLFENDKGIFVNDTVYNEQVFIPWSSIAVLKFVND